MICRRAMLLCGAVLIAAAPVWADMLACFPDPTKVLPNFEFAENGTVGSGLELNAFGNAGSVGGLMTAGVFVDSSEVNNTSNSGGSAVWVADTGASDRWDSKPPSVQDTSFLASSGKDNGLRSLGDSDSRAGASSTSDDGIPSFGEIEGKRGDGTGTDASTGSLVTTLVPEPGSFSLVLLGLTAIGFFVRRHIAPPMAS